ncbi:hypothetical protein ANTQUA_LOCUS9912 [Anthophora quadrimaculata]
MRFHATYRGILTVILALQMVYSQPEETFPNILGGIENVANTASNFLIGLMQRQKALIHRVTDTASDYISSAVEKPRTLLIDATRATTGYIDSAASKGLEFKLRRVLEKFRARMPYGIPELGIPPLEPLHLDHIDIEIDNPDIGNVSLVINDLYLHNLSTFVTNKAKLSLIGPTITANVTIPRIHVEGIYSISGNLGQMVALNGSGPFQGDISDFQLYVNTMLGFSRGVYLKTFDLDFALKSMEINLENFMNDEELSRVMSKVFQELTPKVVDVIKPDILPGIRSYIGGRVNETIHDLTIRDVISVLVGHNDIREFADILVP